MPKETLTRESPEELDSIENSLFTCYASSSSDMPLPSELSLKLTSHQNDYLTELLGSGSIELEAGTTVEEFENDEGLLPIHLASMDGFTAGIRTLLSANFDSISITQQK